MRGLGCFELPSQGKQTGEAGPYSPDRSAAGAHIASRPPPGADCDDGTFRLPKGLPIGQGLRGPLEDRAHVQRRGLRCRYDQSRGGGLHSKPPSSGPHASRQSVDQVRRFRPSAKCCSRTNPADRKCARVDQKSDPARTRHDRDRVDLPPRRLDRRNVIAECDVAFVTDDVDEVRLRER